MKIIFAGTPEFAVPALQMLIESKHQVCAVFAQPDRRSGRGQKLKHGAVKNLALTVGLPVFQPTSINAAAELQQLASYNADLMVVAAYGMILSQSVIEIPKLGCINIHGSLLPRWRGAAPIHRAIMAGDKKTGITIMRVIKKLDAGDMLHKEECVIRENETASQLHDRMAELGAIGLAKVLAAFETGAVIAEQQDESQVTYAKKLEKSEAQLDWSQSAVELARKVRGLNGWPVAQTVFQDKILRIWQAEAINQQVAFEPGRVLNSHRKCLDVATGDGILRLQEVQLPGGKRTEVQSFLNAHDLTGIKLGLAQAADDGCV